MDLRRIDWRGAPTHWCFWIPAGGLRKGRQSVAAGRRHDPPVAWLVHRRWPRRADALRGRWQRLPDEQRATGKTEGLGGSGATTLDAPDRWLDREGIRPRLRGPFGTDRVVAPSGARLSQAEGHSAQARRGQAEGFHRDL